MRVARMCSRAHAINLKGESGRLGVSAVLVAVSLACGAGDGSTPVTLVPSVPPVAETRTGSLQVTTVTSGADLDPDGYVLRVDGEWDYEAEPTKVPTNGTVTLRLTAVSHVLTLLGVSPHCGGENLTDRPIVVAPDAVTETVFELVCTSS